MHAGLQTWGGCRSRGSVRSSTSNGRWYALGRRRHVTTQRFEPEFDADGRIADFLSGVPLEDRPEERVRQKYLGTLHFEHRYPKEVLAREVPIFYGNAVLLDDQGNPRRADIVVYESPQARDARDQGQIRLIVENKAPDETSGHNQLVSYIFNTSANGAVWYKGGQTTYFRRESVPENRLTPWPGIPGPGETWDSVGRQRRSQLLVPADIKGLLKRCHDRLYRRGAAGDDITLDMVR